ncbi:threonine-phosphate decarboxylase [Metabacillus crassostreae]|uniref:threonine-phosphate decarboxylase CobD n=1 Tax=Metabacillus crassostreae TaxID=929098 RepID=UPI0019577F0B|nr:threonine-phosphate decarboxylase CobD [Metabacillus crassostreae]MBM7602986.1 threonine-phosphate decarboxylase [Metabacillus crassostreae]
MKWPAHGGQPSKIYELTGINQNDKIYDFSANLNPLGPPEKVKQHYLQSLELIQNYPDPDYREATKLVSKHENIPKNHLLLTNGGAEAIFLIAHLFLGQKALIIEPTFSEYKRACEVYNIDVSTLSLSVDNSFTLPLETIVAKLHEVDVVFICRPNNPTGTIASINEMKIIIENASKCGTKIIVDEAFIHFAPSEYEDLTSLLSTYSNLILLRSLTKIFSIPGLRLGYIIADEQKITSLRSKQIPWSINGVVTNLLPSLFEDEMFIEQTKIWLQKQLTFLKAELTSLGFYVSPTVVNFYLLQDDHNNTEELFRFLLAHHLIPRHTQTFKNLEGRYLRLAVRNEEENNYLLKVLRLWREQQ